MKYLENEVNSALGYDPADTARSSAELEYFVPSSKYCDFFFFFYPQGLCINKVILGINNSSKRVIT